MGRVDYILFACLSTVCLLLISDHLVFHPNINKHVFYQILFLCVGNRCIEVVRDEILAKEQYFHSINRHFHRQTM